MGNVGYPVSYQLVLLRKPLICIERQYKNFLKHIFQDYDCYCLSYLLRNKFYFTFRINNILITNFMLNMCALYLNRLEESGDTLKDAINGPNYV